MKILFTLFLIAPLLGCRSLVVSHPTRVKPALNRLTASSDIQLDELYARQIRGSDGVLYAMERGRLAQIQGERVRSVADFSVAVDRLRAKDGQAVVTATGIGAQTGAMLVSDNVLPYTPPSYERVMLHHYQALNFLLTGNLEAAAVETRRGNFEQNQALQSHEGALQKVREDAAAEGADSEQAMRRVSQAYAGLDEIAGRVKNSFQNAYAFYLSGVVNEFLDEPNHAYIDYKKALEIMPSNTYLQADVMRLARRLGMREDVAALAERFPQLAAGRAVTGASPPTGELIVIFEDALIPSKRQVKIPLPLIGLDTFTTIAFPIYERMDFAAPLGLAIYDGDRRLARTELICELQALAVRALKEQLPARVTRQIVRATAKAMAVRAAYDNLGVLAAFATGIVSLFTENADLRSWLTLPSNVQIYRGEMAAGRRQLFFRRGDLSPATAVDLDIQEDRVTIVILTLTGATFYQAQATF